MLELEALMRRAGLRPEERLLIKIQACIWPGDHEGLAACLQLCRTLGVARSDVEEVLLQGVLFCGFPRIVNAFRVLNDEWPSTAAPAGGALPPEERERAGLDLFDAIYAGNANGVKAMLRGCHSELHDFVLDTAYGRILSRPGLSPRMRELIAVGVLALTDQVPQMIAHGRGARKFGATVDELREAIYTGVEDEDRTSQLARRV
jgi:4-carboxymuconolactone decarboxylase